MNQQMEDSLSLSSLALSFPPSLFLSCLSVFQIKILKKQKKISRKISVIYLPFSLFFFPYSFIFCIIFHLKGIFCKWNLLLNIEKIFILRGKTLCLIQESICSFHKCNAIVKTSMMSTNIIIKL